MKSIIIVGAGGFGREILGYAREYLKINKDYSIRGFVDDNLNALDGFANSNCKIISSTADHKPQINDYHVVAIGHPQTKIRVAHMLRERGAKFLNFIHPTSVVSDTAKIGDGLIVGPFAFINCDTSLGDFVTVNGHSNIGHDSVVGEGTTLSGHVDITGNSIIGQCVFFGSHASVVPGTTIEDGALVGAGSVVVRRVKANTSVFGVPAKRIQV